MPHTQRNRADRRGLLLGLPARIRQRREAIGMGRAELGRRLRTVPSMVWQWEHGNTLPTLATLIDLAAALGVTADWLLTGQPEAPRGVVSDPDLPRVAEQDGGD